MTCVSRFVLRSLSLAACLVAVTAIGAGPAAASQNALKAFWGPTMLDGASAFPIYKDLGVNLFQIGVNWAGTAPTRPQRPWDPNDPAYTWPADVDYAIQQANAHGMRVLIMVVHAPRWANGDKESSYPAINDADYTAFLSATARRYGGVRHWMIWGEPNNRYTYKGTARSYARLLDRSYATLKRRNRRNLVIGGNSWSGGDDRPVAWVKGMRLPNGRPPRMDLYGHNPFSRRRPVISSRPSVQGFIAIPDIRRFDRILQRSLRRPGRKRLRIFLSEYTLPTDARDGQFNYGVSERTQASWIRDAWRTARREPSIYGLGWIFLRDDEYPGGGNFGGLITTTGRRKPGYYAFKRG